LEKLAYNISLAYELLSRVDAGESIKGMMAGLTGPFPSAREDYKKFAQTQDEYTQK